MHTDTTVAANPITTSTLGQYVVSRLARFLFQAFLVLHFAYLLGTQIEPELMHLLR
jgi:hypothetical protein